MPLDQKEFPPTSNPPTPSLEYHIVNKEVKCISLFPEISYRVQRVSIASVVLTGTYSIIVLSVSYGHNVLANHSL